MAQQLRTPSTAGECTAIPGVFVGFGQKNGDSAQLAVFIRQKAGLRPTGLGNVRNGDRSRAALAGDPPAANYLYGKSLSPLPM